MAINWSKENIEKLKALMANRLSYKQIAKEFDSTVGAVYGAGQRYLPNEKKYAGNVGNNNGQWKGRKSNIKTARERARRILFGARKRTGREVCEECGGPAYDVHHKDGDPWNNDIGNLQSLCRSCHMKADGRLLKLNPNLRGTLGAVSGL